MFVSGLCGLASLPFHPQWSRSHQYMYASVCRSHAFGQCCSFYKSLLIAFPPFPCCSLSSKRSVSILQKLYLQVLHQSLVSTAKWHITLPVYRQYIKNYYLWQYHLLLFTNIRNVCKIKHNFIFCVKISENCFTKRFSCIYIIVSYSDF